MGDDYAKERASLRAQARRREEEAARQFLDEDIFSIRLESRQSPRPVPQQQSPHFEPIPRISQLRLDAASPSSRQAQLAGSSASSLQSGSPLPGQRHASATFSPGSSYDDSPSFQRGRPTGSSVGVSPSYSRQGQLAGASSDSSPEEGGWTSPSSWLTSLIPGGQQVTDHFWSHHVPDCHCFRCRPAYYTPTGDYIMKPIVEYFRGPCPMGCTCPYCLEQRSRWKAQNKCRNDGHKLERPLQCKSRFCACKIGCQEYSCIKCEPRAPENPILRHLVATQSPAASQASGDRSDASPSGTPKSRASRNSATADQDQSVVSRGDALQSRLSTDKIRRRKK
ncbi:hypothetical protein EPUS_06731 [Endocarpon pusillum Z07020]|uniref:Uncharacterized protein n=1 Tax=Endocarpon pusillum (strain Z07020 / HMAS-L-300199) TaxID=1263415 RepID=U1GGP1_ENDPU|nr:uncharacterized protein EPUS_06731 [Endocarpon pusillum Z07020]ERF70946.1 hypothetical protein EPUS_06731 [Endocarpon pusillum Z07020]